MSVKTFALELDCPTLPPAASWVSRELESRLQNCRTLLRWAVVRLEPRGEGAVLYCEGAYLSAT